MNKKVDQIDTPREQIGLLRFGSMLLSRDPSIKLGDPRKLLLMNPVATVLIFGGYLLAIPIGTKLRVFAAQNRKTAIIGFQIGMIAAGLGWLIRHSYTMAGLHILITGVVKVWYWKKMTSPKQTRRPSQHDG